MPWHWRSPATAAICLRFCRRRYGMEFEPTAIPEVLLIKPKVFKDDRGHFFESWTERKFSEAGLDLKFVQDNQNRSEQHVLRGLHYQLTKPQGKLVRVVTGAVFDVAVDLRLGQLVVQTAQHI